jgi:ubiquinone/menaquinone biosynthesis C-methylase UbiE
MKEIENYWKCTSEKYLHKDKNGFGVILYAGMPLWFNKFFNYFQKRKVNKFLKEVDLNNKKVLDVGCGTGRWCFHLKRLFPKANIIGIDIEPERLNKARNLSKNRIRFLEMDLAKLEFPDNYFDFVNSITVLQHIPPSIRKKAINEIVRVLKPKGKILLMELIDTSDEAKHVFPQKSSKWIKAYKSRNCKLIKSEGYEYIPLIRLLRKLSSTIKGKKRMKDIKGNVSIDLFEIVVLKFVVFISYPVEFIFHYLPQTFARHGVFIFQKIEK